MKQYNRQQSNSLSAIFLLTLLQVLFFSNHVAESFLIKPTSRAQNILTLTAQPSTTQEVPKPRRRSRFSPFSRGGKDDSVSMTFTGIHSVASPFIPHQSRDSSLLMEYFTKDKFRNLLFPKNEAVTLNEPPTAEQLQVWKEEAERAGGIGPILNDVRRWGETTQHSSTFLKQTLFQIRAPLDFPGLKITSESTIGMVCVQKPGGIHSNMPEYQFTLLESKTIPEGPTPLVWLFNQITKYQDTTSSFTRVKTMSNPSNVGEIQFVTDARLAIQIKLPSKILKLLPKSVNVTKFEEQGSESIQKLLENDLEPALNDFCEGYRTFAMERQKECELEFESAGALRP